MSHAAPARPRDAEGSSPAGGSPRAGLRPLRLLAAGYLVVAYGGIVRHALTSQPQEQANLEAAEYAAAGLSIGVMLWLPTVGATVGLATLLLPLVAGPTWADLPTVFAAVLLVIARAPRRNWWILIPYGAFVVAIVATQPPSVALLYVAALAISVTVGAGVRVALAASARRAERARALRHQAARAGIAERERLASELDQVATEGINGIERDAQVNSTDPAELDAALTRVGDQARRTLHEIRRLVGGLRSTPELSDTPRQVTWILTGKQIGRAATTLVCTGIVLAVMASGAGTPQSRGTAILSCLAAIALVWIPPVGIVLTAVTLGTALFGHVDEPELLVLLLVASVLAPLRTRDRRLRIAILSGELAFCLAWAPAQVNNQFGDGLRALTAVTLGWGIGLAVRYFTDGRRQELASLREADAARQEAQRAERDELARELHDSVAHHLSLVSLHVVAHGGSDDPVELRNALNRCREYARKTRAELDLLATTVADPSPEVAPGPRAAITSLTGVLVERGYRVTTTVALGTEPMDVRVRLTSVRILQEACTNVLRYARAGGACAIDVVAGDGVVRIRVASDLPDCPQDHDLSSGWGLRGLAERAELLGGRLRSGPVGRQWVVDAELPARFRAAARNPGGPGGGRVDSWE